MGASRAQTTHTQRRATAACARGCTRSTRPPPCPRCSGGGAGGGLARDAPGRAPDGQHAAQQGCGHGRLRALVLRKAPRGEPPMRPVARAMTPAVRPAKRAPPAARGRHAVPAFARGRRARSGCGAGCAGAAHRVWKGRGRQEHDGRWGRASSDGGRRGQTCAPRPPTLPGERPGRRLPSSVATSRRRGAEGRAGGCLLRHERGAKQFVLQMGMHGARKAGSGPWSGWIGRTYPPLTSQEAARTAEPRPQRALSPTAAPPPGRRTTAFGLVTSDSGAPDRPNGRRAAHDGGACIPTCPKERFGRATAEAKPGNRRTSSRQHSRSRYSRALELYPSSGRVANL